MSISPPYFSRAKEKGNPHRDTGNPKDPLVPGIDHDEGRTGGRRAVPPRGGRRRPPGVSQDRPDRGGDEGEAGQAEAREEELRQEGGQ